MRTIEKRMILFWSIIATLGFFSSSFGSTVTYTYDSLNRLTQVAYENGITEAFTYDAAGNRLTHTVTGPVAAESTPATNVTANSATLNGTVNPNGLETSYHFEWGLNDSYGNTTNIQFAGSGIGAVGVSAHLTGLNPGTTYHYRLVATNSSGTSYGMHRTFTTQISGHGDYDGDGKTDISVWRPGDGNWYVRNSATGTIAIHQWGLGSLNDWPVPGDFDGDGKMDYGIWRPGDGMWYILRSSDGGMTATQWGTGTFFAKSDVPVPGDYDGDGKTDIAVWRPGDGMWYILRSTDGGMTATQWGTGSLNDVPVPGDYDGDGKTDIAVWRPGDGNWYILRSSDGGMTITQWGTSALNDVPVPGDYDGDGKTDIAVWRPSTGMWYILRSSDGGMTITQWGTGTQFAKSDVPVPGDYDGDGKTDIAVWRPGDGNWYILRSSDGGMTITQWGTGDLNDIPITENPLIYRYLEGSLY